MKLWNRWVFDHPLQGDRDAARGADQVVVCFVSRRSLTQRPAQVPKACWHFVKNFHAELLAGDLRHNLLIHLFHFWDNSLISAGHITEIMAAFDDEAARAPPPAAEAEMDTSG